MKVIDGYTSIPSDVLKGDAIKNLNNKEFRTLIILYQCMNFNEHAGSILTGFSGRTVTTLRKLKGVLGYANKNLSIDGLKAIIRTLEEKLFLSDLCIAEDGTVSATLNNSRARGTVYIYNNRLMKGSKRLRDGDLKVYLLLLSYGQHERINITYRYMGERLGVHEKTIKANISSLEKKGLIEKHPKNIIQDGDIKTYNSYTILEKVDFGKIAEQKRVEQKQDDSEIFEEVF